jgi:Haem degrading protein HbpS-like
LFLPIAAAVGPSGRPVALREDTAHVSRLYRSPARPRDFVDHEFCGGGGGCGTCNVISEKALSLDLAKALALGALAKCRADANHVSVTVLDRDGLVQIAFRDDGAGPHTIVTSQRQALTSVTFRQTSAQWAHRVPTEPALAGPRIPLGPSRSAAVCRSRPATRSSVLSGSAARPAATKDEACANGGIARVADKLK